MQGQDVNNKSLSPLLLVVSYFSIFLSSAFINHDALENLFQRWLKFDENLGHALPMLCITSFFLYKASKPLQLRDGLPLSTLILIPLLIILSGLAKLYSILIVQQLVIWLYLCMAFLVLFKTDSVTKSLFPLGLFIFIIPIWDQFVPLLASLTAYVVQIALELSGIIAFFEGRDIELPYGIITVADACSGVRYVTIGLALSYLSAFTLPVNLNLRLKIILIGFALSVFANWLRVYIIVVVAYHTEMQTELVKDHEMFGFVLFSILISPIAFYKPKSDNEQDVLATKLLKKLESFFEQETQPLKLSVKVLLLFITSFTSAILLHFI